MRLYLILLPFLVACQPAKKNLSISREANHQSLIQEWLGGEYEYEANGDGNYWLCKRSAKLRPGQVVFLVYDLTNQKVIYQESLENGNVEWETDSTVKITAGIGNRTKEYPDGYRTYYFDVRKGKTIDSVSKNN